jgi:uncharacterized protein (DUF2252 family)
MKRFLLPLFICTASIANAQTDAFDRVKSAYAPYLSEQDTLSLPMKIRSLASDEYKFWRGSKDLFFQWGKQNCQDWLKDPKAFLPNHGDLHLGNIGSYVTEEGLHTLSFGMVDFDDSARLPFEFELLQGVITLDLVIRQNKLELTPEQIAQIDDKLFESYRYAVNSRRNAGQMLKDVPTVAKLLAEAGKKPYADDLDKFTEAGKFRLVVKKKDSLTDILDPVDPRRWDDFAQAIVEAIKHDERLKRLMPEADLKSVRKQIRDIARRTRIGSSGSQGLNKFLVLLEKPFVGIDHDIILYFKQEIPTAAERSGIVPADSRSPGERCSGDMDKMTEPRAFINSYATLEGNSYWVHFKEPWSDEIAFEKVGNVEQLMEMAYVWGTVVGATHRDEGRFELILPRLSPELRTQIRERANAYLAYQRAAFAAFRSDVQVKGYLDRVEQYLLKRQSLKKP